MTNNSPQSPASRPTNSHQLETSKTEQRRCPLSVNIFELNPIERVGQYVYTSTTDDRPYVAEVAHSNYDSQPGGRYDLVLYEYDSDLDASPLNARVKRTKCGTRTLRYGPQNTHSELSASQFVWTQLWEWGRRTPESHTISNQAIEQDALPNPHPPGERPSLPSQWYYSLRSSYKQLSIPDSHRHGYSQQSSYTLKLSNSDKQWYCGTVNLSFNHSPPNTVTAPTNDNTSTESPATADEGTVWGVYLYLQMNFIKPISERETENDRRTYERICLRHDNPDEPTPIERLQQILSTAKERLRNQSEAIGDADRREILKREEHLTSSTKSDDSNQMALTGFTESDQEN